MSFFEELVAGVEMACPLDANHRVKMVVRKIQFGRVHYLEGAAGCPRARIRNLRVRNVNAGNHLGRISLRQPLSRTPESASHIQNPACSVGDSRDHLIDEGFARLPLRLRPCAPVAEIEIAAIPEVATLIAAAHHAVIGAGTHRPSHRHHAHPCPGGASDWGPSHAQRSIRHKGRSDCSRSTARQAGNLAEISQRMSEPSTLKRAESSGTDSRAVGPRNSKLEAVIKLCPLCPRKRTSRVCHDMSASCQEATYAPQQTAPRSPRRR